MNMLCDHQIEGIAIGHRTDTRQLHRLRGKSDEAIGLVPAIGRVFLTQTAYLQHYSNLRGWIIATPRGFLLTLYNDRFLQHRIQGLMNSDCSNFNMTALVVNTQARRH